MEKEIEQDPIQIKQKKYLTNKNTYIGKTTQKQNNCGFCGQQNWTPLHKCPANTLECNNCHKHEEEGSEPEEIRQIT